MQSVYLYMNEPLLFVSFIKHAYIYMYLYRNTLRNYSVGVASQYRRSDGSDWGPVYGSELVGINRP